MAQNVTIAGASYSDVPAVDLPKSGGGTARFVDTSADTVTAAHLESGYTAHGADGEPILGALNPSGGTTVHNELSGRDAADAHPMSAITGLSDAFAAKANDSTVVHKTGNETVAGIKTFDDNTFFNGTATWANCDPNFISQFMYGMYQWDNMFQFTKRNTSNGYINEAWHIQLDTEQTVFNYATSFASRPTVGGVQVALTSDIPTTYTGW